MSDPVSVAARGAARRLEPTTVSGLAAEVEAVLAARQSPVVPPPQYTDPVALANLIVATTTLAWTVYIDLRKRTARPARDLMVRTVRVTLHDTSQVTAPDHIIDIIVTETIKAASGSESAEQ